VLRGRGRWLVDSNGSRGGPMNHQSSAGTDCPYSIQQSAAGSRSKTLLLVCFSSLTHSIGHAMHYKILKRDEEVRSGDRESIFNCSAIGATRQRRNDAGNNEKRKAMRMNLADYETLAVPPFSHPFVLILQLLTSLTLSVQPMPLQRPRTIISPLVECSEFSLTGNFTSPTVRIIP